jgi:pimeloyl-ACP methyl ester carboxylesterase
MPAAARSVQDVYGVAERSAWMDIDWQAHRRFVELDGRRANVVEIGEGPPLLFVHGLSGCWQNWLENLPHFAATRRCVAVDLPGFGASEMPREDIAIAGYARFLDRLCDTLGIDAAAVVGNSMGGFVAAELAIAFPQRVERLMLVSAAGITAEHLHADAIMTGARVIAATADWAASRHEAFARRPALRRLALSLVVRHPHKLSAALAFELMEGSGKPGFLPAMAAILAHPISERLPEIACPTSIVWGANDRIIPVRDADAFERLIPDARKVIFADTGHVAMLERPARFNALLDEFLAEQPATAPPAPAAADAPEPLSA